MKKIKFKMLAIILFGCISAYSQSTMVVNQESKSDTYIDKANQDLIPADQAPVLIVGDKTPVIKGVSSAEMQKQTEVRDASNSLNVTQEGNTAPVIEQNKQPDQKSEFKGVAADQGKEDKQPDVK